MCVQRFTSNLYKKIMRKTPEQLYQFEYIFIFLLKRKEGSYADIKKIKIVS